MIVYFSGTGNSRRIALHLAELIEDRAINMEEGAAPKPQEGERLVLVAPLYFWGLPQLVLDYLQRHTVLQVPGLHSVITFGGSMGKGSSVIAAQLRRIGYPNVLIHPLATTTNYIPLHEVDAPELAKQKMQCAMDALPAIAADIRANRGEQGTATAAFAGRAIYSLYAIARQTRRFRVSDKCIHCALCAKRCPDQAITMVDGLPRWTKSRCTHCLRCLSNCPTAAIDYGPTTKGKQRHKLPPE